MEELYQELLKNGISVKQSILLKSLTTLHIGGIASMVVQIHHIDEIKLVASLCKQYEIPFYILGKGSNVLASDDGYKGVIIQLSTHFSKITRVNETMIKVQSGATLKAISEYCIQHSLGGFEFACGIPGSAGGGIIMNAGAYDGETKDIVKEVTFLDENLDMHTFTNEQLEFSYRHSYFSNNFGIVLEIVYELYPKEQSHIQDKVDELMKRRYDKQPMDKYSAGSTFKRPQGNYASALIRQSDLMGFTIGEASVSTKHAGFLINLGDASSKDFQSLITYVKTTVKQKSGYELECEIKFL